MKGGERNIYMVGDFYARYWGEKSEETGQGANSEFKIHPYEPRINHARFVEDPELPEPESLNYMQPEVLRSVVIYFEEDPAGYGKPFREDLRNPVIAHIKLEGVVQERKRTYGTMRGKVFAKVHTTVLPAKQKT